MHQNGQNHMDTWRFLNHFNFFKSTNEYITLINNVWLVVWYILPCPIILFAF